MPIGHFVWFDALTRDKAATEKFYTQLFGWGTQDFPMGEQTYKMFTVDGEPFGGVGEIPEDQEMPAMWVSFLQVDDVDRAARLAEDSGGKVLSPPMDIPEVGRFAMIADPAGGVLAPFTPLKDMTVSDKPGINEVGWVELMTADPKAVQGFYSELCGWEFEEMDMGGGMIYHVAKVGEKSVAGMMAFPPEAPKMPMWGVYISVADADATAAKAGELGGQTLFDLMDIPGVGRFGGVLDPGGAMISFIKFEEE
jgi:uncharacterized protein